MLYATYNNNITNAMRLLSVFIYFFPTDANLQLIVVSSLNYLKNVNCLHTPPW